VKSQKIVMYILMTGLVLAWGLDYIAAKKCLEVLDTFVLLFFRYCLALTLVFVLKLIVDRKFKFVLKDLPLFLLCAITGEIGYFYLEYTAIAYLPLSVLTLILSCVPIVSLLIEKIFFKRTITPLMVAGMIGSVVGVSIIIGADFSILFQGRITGYLLAFGAVLSWNAYNFVTARLHDNYSDLSLSFYQISCTTLLLAPYALRHLHEAGAMTPELTGWLFFLGLLSAGLGFVIYVRSLHILGVTQTSLFSNFLPISTTIFAWIFFKEMISPMQIFGGIIVIIAACVVINEKGKVDALHQLKKGKQDD
jgi:drug/metabolite transporter (DMT)-like permease